MWETIASAGVGGLFGAFGANDSAKKYLQGVRETNEQNYKIWQEQQQHNIDMFNMENDANVRNWQNQFDQTNAYNSASAQRQRLEEAGLNPALMMNGGNAGVASSSGISSAHATPAQAPQMQAPQQVESPLSSFGREMINAAVGVSQALDLNSQTDERDGLYPFKEDNLRWQTKKFKEDVLGGRVDRLYKESMTRLADWQLKFNERTMKSRVMLQDQILTGQILNNIGQHLSNDAQQTLNDYLSAQQQADLTLKAYQSFSLFASGNLSREKLRTEIANQVLAYTKARESASQAELNKQLKNESVSRSNQIDAQTEGIKTDNKQKDLDYQSALKLADSYIQSMQATYGYEQIVGETGISWFTDPNNANQYHRNKSGLYNRGKSKFNYGFNGIIPYFDIETDTEDAYP